MPGHPKSAGQKFTSTQIRDAELWDLRREGWSIEQLAQHFKISKHTVSARISLAADALEIEAAEHIVKLELDRLDLLLRKAMEVLERRHVAYSHGKLMTDEHGEAVTDSAPVLQAIAAVLKIQDRRARYLGLDAPTKSEQNISVYKADATDLALQDMINEAKAAAANITPDRLAHAAPTPPTPAPQINKASTATPANYLNSDNDPFWDDNNA